MEIDFRAAFNTISDVVQNRPIPLREFDQIYMKVGDMIIQTEFIARKYDGLSVIFIGDGDAISLSMMHLKMQGILDYGPEKVEVLDFDERIVNSINKFAIANNMTHEIHAQLYNVAKPLPELLRCNYGAFYTNPPWGASNDGESVFIFVERGIESLIFGGSGAIVIADDENLDWTQIVLQKTQKKVIDMGFLITEMIPGLHSYHLDDAPDLKSCTVMIKQVYDAKSDRDIEISADRLTNFYGRNNPLKVKFVKDLSGLHYGKAPDETYELEPLEIQNDTDNKS